MSNILRLFKIYRKMTDSGTRPMRAYSGAITYLSPHIFGRAYSNRKGRRLVTSPATRTNAWFFSTLSNDPQYNATVARSSSSTSRRTRWSVPRNQPGI
ncbi:hypothetical protein D3C73_756260 [compost metagenome]